MFLHILQNASGKTFAYFFIIYCYKKSQNTTSGSHIISFHVHYVVSTHNRKLKQKVDRNQMYTRKHTCTCKWLCKMPIIFCLVTVYSLLIMEYETRLCMCEYDHTIYWHLARLYTKNPGATYENDYRWHSTEERADLNLSKIWLQMKLFAFIKFITKILIFFCAKQLECWNTTVTDDSLTVYLNKWPTCYSC
jgi:hypothetical protein